MTAFQDFVNTELPLRVNISGEPTANNFPRFLGFAGSGRGVEERTPAQVLVDIAAAPLIHATRHRFGGEDEIALLGFFNGIFLESFDAVVTSDGATVTMSLEKRGGGDLTQNFSSGQSTLDCTPPATIALTAGTDTVPILNRVYILQSAPGVLVVTTGLWPSAEHIKVGPFLIPSATFVQARGAYTNQNINDYAAETITGQGHLSHITERIRNMGSQWISGCQGVATVDTAETPDAVWVSMTAGIASQLHRHTFAALDSDPDGGNDIILVINQSGTPFEPIQNLADLVNDSTGSPLGANKYFAVVLWAVINKSGEFSPMGLNLPSGTYNTLSDAQQDLQGYTDYSRPSGFGIESTLGFLVARFILRNSANMTLEDTLDLRGDTPETIGGGGGAGDVVAASPLTNNAIVIGDGGAKGVRTRGPLIDNSDNMSGIGNITLSGTVDGVNVAAHADRHTDGSDDIQDATDAVKGIAKFNPLNFSTSAGQVSFGLREPGGPSYVLLTTTSALTVNRDLTFVPGDSDRTITLIGNPTLDNWFDQSVKVAAIPTFGGLTVNSQTTIDGSADEVQLLVEAHSTQTSDIMQMKDSSAATILQLSDNGKLTALQLGIGQATSDTTVVFAVGGSLVHTGTPTALLRGLLFSLSKNANETSSFTATGCDMTAGGTSVVAAGKTGLFQGGLFLAALGAVQTSATATIAVRGGTFRATPGSWKHTGGNLQLISAYFQAPITPLGSPTTSFELAGFFADDMQMADNKKIILEGSITTKADTYMVYNTSNSHIEFWIDGVLEGYVDSSGFVSI